MDNFDTIVWQSNITGIEGTIELQRLSYIDKMKMMKEMNIAFKEDEETKEKKVVFNSDEIDQLIVMKRWLDLKVKKVDLKFAHGTITEWNKLEYCNGFQEIVNELQALLMKGLDLGNA